MGIIGTDEIKKRLHAIPVTNPNPAATNTFIESARVIASSNNLSNIKRCISEMSMQTKADIPFMTFMELFDVISENGNPADITRMGHIIAEGVVHRSRNMKELQALLKGRLTRRKNKANATNQISGSIEDLKQKYKVTPITVNREAATIAAYEEMLAVAEKCQHCDRVLENYNNISKRFNLERLFTENTKVNGVTDTVYELCKFVDTYNMPDYVKFNTVIETALYGFESTYTKYDKSTIVEAALDYFAFKKNAIHTCIDILKESVFFGELELVDSYKKDNIKEKPEEITDLISQYNNTEKPAKLLVEEAGEFDDIFRKFKEEESDNAPESKLRNLVNKLYSRNVSNVAGETPHFLSWMRSFFIVGTAAVPFVGPVIAALGMIADRIKQRQIDREEIPKMIKAFTTEINAAEKKLETLENVEEKENMKKYIKALKDTRSKISDFEDALLDDEELDEKMDNCDYLETDPEIAKMFGGDIDFDFDDDDLFDESSVWKSVKDIEVFIEYASKNPLSYNRYLNFIKNTKSQYVTELASIIAKYPEYLMAENFKNAMEFRDHDIRSNTNDVFQSRIESGMIRNANGILETTNPIKLTKNPTIIESILEFNDIADCYKCISEAIAISEDAAHLSPVMEASIGNKLRMISQNIRRAMTKLSDKDRKISQAIDVSVNNLAKSTERAFTNDNREAVIKGSMLPSASKLIKLGIMNAGLVIAGQPAIAAIGTLGYVGVNKRFKAKERQLVADEIDIEIKMCDKYIELAEQKNDMQALKELMMIKRNLTRQYQRIKYKMKADLGQKYFEPSNVGDR